MKVSIQWPTEVINLKIQF